MTDHDYIDRYIEGTRTIRELPLFVELTMGQLYSNINRGWAASKEGDPRSRLSWHFISSAEKHSELVEWQGRRAMIIDAGQIVFFTRLNYCALTGDPEHREFVLLSEIAELAAQRGELEAFEKLAVARRKSRAKWRVDPDTYQFAHYLAEIQMSFLIDHEMAHFDVVTNSTMRDRAINYYHQLRPMVLERESANLDYWRGVDAHWSQQKTSAEDFVQSAPPEEQAQLRQIAADFETALKDAVELARSIHAPTPLLLEEILCDLLAIERAIRVTKHFRFTDEERPHVVSQAVFCGLAASAMHSFITTLATAAEPPTYQSMSQTFLSTSIRIEFAMAFIVTLWMASVGERQAGELSDEDVDRIGRWVSAAAQMAYTICHNKPINLIRRSVVAAHSLEFARKRRLQRLTKRISLIGFSDIDDGHSLFRP